MKCSICNSYHSEKTHGYLEAAKSALEAANPGKVFVLDSGAVWLRDSASGKDYGIYSSTILDEKIVYCMNENGRTVLHRPSAEATA
jgi:hypothetical protein